MRPLFKKFNLSLLISYKFYFLAGLAVMSVGCTVGWTTPTLKNLKKPGSPIPINDEEKSWIAAAHEVGHFISPIPSGLLVGSIGRKYSLLGASLIIVIGWIIIVCSNTVTTIYVARFMFGISMGIVFTTVPLYIAEIASPRIRGALSTCFQAMLYFGHLIEFSIGPYVSFFTLNIVSLVIACVTFVSLFFIVESPLYYLLKGKREKAYSTIEWLKITGEDDIDSEMCRLQAQVYSSRSGRFLDLFNRRYGRKLFIVVFAAVAQRFTGMSAIVAYAATTFSNTNGLNSDEYTIIFGALVFAFTFVSASLIDNIGRRPLLLFSCFGCAVTHFITATYYYEKATSFAILPFLMISLFSIIYSLGLGPLVNTLQGELFPPNIKGLASSLVTVAHAASSFAVTKLFPVIKEKEGIYLNFYVFGASCIISLIISYFIVPETKREDLETLQKPHERYT